MPPIKRYLRMRADEGTPSWRGTGVSPGVGLGPARVVAAGQSVRLEPGEVLVTPVLDAALGRLPEETPGEGQTWG